MKIDVISVVKRNATVTSPIATSVVGLNATALEGPQVLKEFLVKTDRMAKMGFRVLKVIPERALLALPTRAPVRLMLALVLQGRKAFQDPQALKEFRVFVQRRVLVETARVPRGRALVHQDLEGLQVRRALKAPQD